MVWVIGLSRTGTTSLAHALYVLGYANYHNPDAESMLRGDFSVLDGWKGGSDISVAAHYRELDEAFPGSRFVLSVRERDAWLRSVRTHFDRLPPETDHAASGAMRRKVYGDPRPTDEQFLDAYDRHHAEVRAYFAGRDDYTEIDVASGDAWDALCPFLGHEVPDQAFPHTNRTQGPDAHGTFGLVKLHQRAAERLAQRRAA